MVQPIGSPIRCRKTYRHKSEGHHLSTPSPTRRETRETSPFYSDDEDDEVDSHNLERISSPNKTGNSEAAGSGLETSNIRAFTLDAAESYTREVRSRHGNQREKSQLTITRKTTLSLKPAERIESSFLVYQVTIVVVLAIIMGGFLFGRSSSVPVKARRNCSTIDSLSRAFPHQSKYLWKAIKSGVEGVLNGEPPKPSVILLLHRDHKSTRNIVQAIIDAASSCFGPTFKAKTIESNELNSKDVINDFGVSIERYKVALKNGGVVFIADLNDIKSQAARALHFICDNENPLVENVIIFMTLKPDSDIGKPVEMAEETLNKIWRTEIDENTLSAIVTRVTDQVIELYPEKFT